MNNSIHPLLLLVSVTFYFVSSCKSRSENASELRLLRDVTKDDLANYYDEPFSEFTHFVNESVAGRRDIFNWLFWVNGRASLELSDGKKEPGLALWEHESLVSRGNADKEFRVRQYSMVLEIAETDRGIDNFGRVFDAQNQPLKCAYDYEKNGQPSPNFFVDDNGDRAIQLIYDLDSLRAPRLVRQLLNYCKIGLLADQCEIRRSNGAVEKSDRKILAKLEDILSSNAEALGYYSSEKILLRPNDQIQEYSVDYQYIGTFIEFLQMLAQNHARAIWLDIGYQIARVTPHTGDLVFLGNKIGGGVDRDILLERIAADKVVIYPSEDVADNDITDRIPAVIGRFVSSRFKSETKHFIPGRAGAAKSDEALRTFLNMKDSPRCFKVQSISIQEKEDAAIKIKFLQDTNTGTLIPIE